MVPVFKIVWTDYAKGYDDLLPCEQFRREVQASREAHIVTGPRGAHHPARYLLTVTGREATLDYGDDAVRAFNERHEILLGRTRLTFTSNRRTAIERVWWNDEAMDSKAA